MKLSKNRAHYIQICEQQKSIPVFLQYWWLDIVVGQENWDVIIYEEKGNLLGVLPFCFTKKKFFNGIGMPLCTHFLGHWLFYPQRQAYAKRLSFEKKVITALYEQLPENHFFEQLISPVNTNWLPLYWKGFQQTTYYTYVIEDLSNLEMVFDNFATKVRGDIRKAESMLQFSLEDDMTILHSLLQKNFERQNLPMPYSIDLFKRIHAVCKSKDCGQLLIAKDGAGNVHAAHYLLIDRTNETAYSILRASDYDLASSGANSFLLWKSMQENYGGVKCFDFVGSYLPAVEKFIRGFGAKPVPYFYITKEHSFAYKMSRRFYELKL